MNELKTGSQEQPTSATPGGHIARRRLLRAGMAAAPLMLAVSGRSAMATNTDTPVGLSPMAWNSVAPNGTFVAVSHTVGTHKLGESPDHWIDKAKSNSKYLKGVRFKDIFGGSSDSKLRDILRKPKDYDYELHFTAAYLNVQASGGNYAITLKELKDLYSDRTLVPKGNVLTKELVKAFLAQTWV